MRVLAAFAAVLSIPAFFSHLVAANPHDSVGHAALAKHRRAVEATETANHTLSKRDFSNARYTYYLVEVGEVACGGWYKDGDHVRCLSNLV